MCLFQRQALEMAEAWWSGAWKKHLSGGRWVWVIVCQVVAWWCERSSSGAVVWSLGRWAESSIVTGEPGYVQTDTARYYPNPTACGLLIEIIEQQTTGGGRKKEEEAYYGQARVFCVLCVWPGEWACQNRETTLTAMVRKQQQAWERMCLGWRKQKKRRRETNNVL